MLRPLHDNVVLEVEPTEEKVGGLIIPKKGEKTAVAKVVAVGPGINKDGKQSKCQLKLAIKFYIKNIQRQNINKMKQNILSHQ